MPKKPLHIPWLAAGIAWAVHWGLYLCFTANIGWRELIVGVISSAISVTGVVVFAIQANMRFHLRWRDIRQAWRIPWNVLTGTSQVLWGIARELFGLNGPPAWIAAVPFDVGGPDPADAGRRALAVSYTTLTPNFVIFGIFPRQRLLLYHQISPGKVPTMTRNLGACP